MDRPGNVFRELQKKSQQRNGKSTMKKTMYCLALIVTVAALVLINVLVFASETDDRVNCRKEARRKNDGRKDGCHRRID